MIRTQGGFEVDVVDTDPPGEVWEPTAWNTKLPGLMVCRKVDGKFMRLQFRWGLVADGGDAEIRDALKQAREQAIQPKGE